MMSILKYLKGHNSVQNKDGVMVLVLCTSSDHALYCTKFHQNMSQHF